jgi:hypothetical protein
MMTLREFTWDGRLSAQETRGRFRGGGDDAELEATPQLGEDLASGSWAAKQTRPPSPCSLGDRRQRQLQYLLDRTERGIRK